MEREGEIPTYDCVFISHSCPVRSFFKLRPESLALFCATCPLIREDKAETQDNRQKTEAIYQIMSVALQKLGSMFEAQSGERKHLLDLVEKLALAHKA